MSWKKLLANSNITREAPSKAELDNLPSIVARSMKDVAAPGLSADARFVMAYDAARTLSLMWCGRRAIARALSAAITTLSWRWKRPMPRLQGCRRILMVAGSSGTAANTISPAG